MQVKNNEETKIIIGCTDDEAKYITQKILQFNDNKINKERDVEKINLLLRDDDGKVLGGILGAKFFNCLRMHLQWVDNEYRGLGYGKKLLFELEKIAEEKGCDLIYFNTYSFKEPKFYKEYGYKVIGVEDNYPEGYKRYYFKKSI